MKAVPWDSPPQKAGGRILRWKEGRNRIRLLTQPVEFEREYNGEVRVECFAAVLDLDDANAVKFAPLKPTMIAVLHDFFVENGVAPDAKEAPAFCITRTGSGLQTRYSTLPGGKPCPVSAEVDVAKTNAELMELVGKLEKRKPGAGDGKKNDPLDM